MIIRDFEVYSFPFSLGPIKNRIFFDEPERGDVVVFKTPADNRTDYIKRLIGLPGDRIQFIDGNLYLNDLEILKSKTKLKNNINCGQSIIDVSIFEEKISDKIYLTSYLNNGTYKNSDVFSVPKDHYFFLGDNRDCSKDSRYLSSVGFVHKNNLVGKAQFIFFSTDIAKGSIFEIWKWKNLIRFNRFFKKII